MVLGAHNNDANGCQDHKVFTNSGYHKLNTDLITLCAICEKHNEVAKLGLD